MLGELTVRSVSFAEVWKRVDVRTKVVKMFEQKLLSNVPISGDEFEVNVETMIITSTYIV